MGHYYSEMYSDTRTKKEKEKDSKKAKRKEELQKKLCEVFDCKKSELKYVYDILKDSWYL